MSIGDNIKRLRLERDLSQEYIAKRLNVSPQAIYKYEQGIVTNIPLDKIQMLADTFHVSPGEILGWEESSKPVKDKFSDSVDIKHVLKDRRAELGLTLLDVAKAVGVSEATVSRWESGDIANMRRDKISILAQVLRISPLTIMGYDNMDQKKDSETLSESDIKKYGIRPIQTQKLRLLGDIACGQPIYANEERDSYVEVGTDIKADFCLRAKGDSMINARIHDGDIVFIRSQNTVDNGQIAAVIIEDEVTLKRVYYYREKGIIILKPENPAFKDLIYSGEELNQVHILGLAVAFQSDII